MMNSSLSGILHDALGQQECRQLLLVSRVGTLIASAVRDSEPLSPALAPIVASNFATGSELSRLLGNGECEYLLQRGHRQDFFLCQMPRSGMILAATFPVQVTESATLEFATRLLNQIESLTPSLDAYADPLPLPPEIRQASLSLLDQLFPAAA
jgi:predicted regulator of Ras-like GTPase activity (Roadblock/LC7/MglB family)